MAELSHSALRILITDFEEPDEYFTEMIHAPSAISGGGFEKWYFKSNPNAGKLVWQITSPEIEAAVKTVPLLLSRGGIGIDLNMGCCAPQIVKTGAGFAWMQKPLSEVAVFVSSMKKAIQNYEKENSQKGNNIKERKFRLSVKLRLGERADYEFLLKFSKMLVGEGVDLITLHPRIQKQKYSRPCNHEFTAKLAEDLRIPVYGNGDIDSFEKLKTCSSQYQCSGWMIGRAVVQKPWLFYELKSKLESRLDKTFEIDLVKISENFINYLKTEQAPEFYKSRALRFYSYFCDNFSFAHFAKSKVLNAKSLESMHEEIIAYLKEVPSDRFIKPFGV